MVSTYKLRTCRARTHGARFQLVLLLSAGRSVLSPSSALSVRARYGYSQFVFQQALKYIHATVVPFLSTSNVHHSPTTPVWRLSDAVKPTRRLSLLSTSTLPFALAPM